VRTSASPRHRSSSSSAAPVRGVGEREEARRGRFRVWVMPGSISLFAKWGRSESGRANQPTTLELVAVARKKELVSFQQAFNLGIFKFATEFITSQPEKFRRHSSLSTYLCIFPFFCVCGYHRFPSF
jgi:hypothetical protein